MSPLLDADEDDVTLPTRRSGGAVDRRSVDLEEPPADREVTLNTGTVLALFFTLALICAVFFGFGYSMGRKSALTSPAADASAAPASTDTESSKPAPGSPAIQPIPGYLSQSEANEANAKAGSNVTTTAPAQVPAPVKHAETPAPTPAPAVVADSRPAVSPVRIPPAMAPAPAANYSSAASTASGLTYVQIAAVSHQEDADVLTSALKRRGYQVITRTDPGDRLIHVQIGPFNNRKDAEVIRQKLLGDGYNAFLK